MKTIDKVKKLIAEQLCISTDEISDTANILEDLGADEFGVSIPDEQVAELKTIPAIVKIIDEHTK